MKDKTILSCQDCRHKEAEIRLLNARIERVGHMADRIDEMLLELSNALLNDNAPPDSE